MKTLKTYMLLAAAAILMAACMAEPVQQGSEQPETAAGQLPLGFSAYARRTADTKAGLTGELDLTALQKGKAEGGGFGVFAYYTGDRLYDREPQAPDFMYNQGVFYNGAESAWEYSPVKYWPNTEGENVSFFAYAPYVAMNPATGEPASGSADWGITGMGAVREEGDPYIRYKAGFTVAESVDLCWAAPMKDCTRPGGVEDKVSLSFSHATALLDVRVDTYTDETEDPADPAAQTRIYIRSVTFKGFAAAGALNLDSPAGTPAWMDYDGTQAIPSGTVITLHDGRKDGAEGSLAAAYEEFTGLNPDVLESTSWNDPAHTPGVTATERPLFANPAGACVIPTGGSFRITLVYEVETRSTNLATTLSDGITPGTTVRNSITKNINFGTETALSAGKRYTLKLHLGLSSVKFDAEVTDWAQPFSMDFAYTGSVQTCTIPTSGYYTLEAWGAEGGQALNNGTSSVAPGGKGGYSTVSTYLEKGQTLYVYVGGKGGDANSGSATVGSAGWNGGGKGGIRNGRYTPGGGGGGATHMAIRPVGNITASNALQTEGTTPVDGLLLVAGGGGGGCHYSGFPGGAGGGITGGLGRTYDGFYFHIDASPYWYNDDYKSVGKDAGRAATGQSGSMEGPGGGGGGFRGGNARGNYPNLTRQNTSGCGGSSWGVDGFKTKSGTDAITEPDGSLATGHAGNGYARIFWGKSAYLPE